MADQDQRLAAGPRLVEQPQDLGLHRDVERRRRFVGNQQLRIQRERGGDQRPLALAPRQLMRQLSHLDLGIRHTDELQQRDDALGQFGFCYARTMQTEAFADLPADRSQLIERHQRILQDKTDILAAQAPPVSIRYTNEVVPVEAQLVGTDEGVLPGQADEAARCHALPRTGFSDDGKAVSRIEREGNAP